MKIASGEISIKMDGSSGFFSRAVLGKYGAPGLWRLNACGAPPLDEEPYPLQAYVLNRVFRGEHPDPIGKLILMFGRRVVNAIHEYAAGRTQLLEYVQGLSKSNSHFMQAMLSVTHFEQCIASTSQASAFLKRLLPPQQLAEFTDDRVARLILIYNRSKHFDQDIVEEMVENITTPVWLTNTDISSTDGSIKFTELHAVLVEMRTAFANLTK